MAPHEDIEHPQLRFVFCIDFHFDEPVVVPNTPTGTRVLIPIVPGGTFKGGEGYEDFRGTIVAPSSDWATAYQNNEPGLYLDVKLVFKTHDGDVVLGMANGRSERNPDDLTKAKIHTCTSFETGAEKHMWMNKKVLVGKGRKDGLNIKINYYEIV
eukprot:CAMPEP_0194283382 /NCGR_PEP_ID=MMETSP0169-20130528/25252_1 /TAXON_ID=218684 /ORGANISM="Corethron pennatum, Strain L29A3" /LENGTH=154 /DNA_ID=CAMNT_0039028973 /DNA_START=40 /DNA_END=504 /DNA_ORIENTATION=-